MITSSKSASQPSEIDGGVCEDFFLYPFDPSLLQHKTSIRVGFRELEFPPNPCIGMVMPSAHSTSDSRDWKHTESLPGKLRKEALSAHDLTGYRQMGWISWCNSLLLLTSLQELLIWG